MSDGFDIAGWALIVTVAMLFVWYFWHVATSIVSGARRISEIADGAAERQRAELEHEVRNGPRPLWYRTVQKLIIVVLVIGTGLLIWDRLPG